MRIDPKQEPKGIWLYKPPRWWSFYRGGRFYHVHEIPKEAPWVKQALESSQDQIKSGAFKWLSYVTGTGNWGRLEVNEIWIKAVEDAVSFKLAHCNL